MSKLTKYRLGHKRTLDQIIQFTDSAPEVLYQWGREIPIIRSDVVVMPLKYKYPTSKLIDVNEVIITANLTTMPPKTITISESSWFPFGVLSW